MGIDRGWRAMDPLMMDTEGFPIQQESSLDYTMVRRQEQYSRVLRSNQIRWGAYYFIYNIIERPVLPSNSRFGIFFGITVNGKDLDNNFNFRQRRQQNMYNYSHRQNIQPISQSHNNLNTRKNRFISTALNPLNQSSYLPQLSRSSSKSTKLKLTTIQATLSSLEQELQALKADTRETRRFTNFLKDQLGESQLGMLKLQLHTEANKLDKAFKVAKKHDEDRTQYLKSNCDGLLKSSRKMKALLSQLHSRLDKCESVMGVYSGKQRHKM